MGWPGCPPACCAWLDSTAIIVIPASLFCPKDARMGLLMCLRAETLLSCLVRPIGEVAPMSTSCLTWEKMSPSHTDSITRRCAGREAVFLGWEILMYNLKFRYKYSRRTARNPYGGCFAPCTCPYVCMRSFHSQNLEAEPAASQPVLPVPLHVQTDNMAASSPVASLLDGGVVFVRKWTFPDIKGARPLEGSRGVFPWGKLAVVGLMQEKTFPAFYARILRKI